MIKKFFKFFKRLLNNLVYAIKQGLKNRDIKSEYKKLKQIEKKLNEYSNKELKKQLIKEFQKWEIKKIEDLETLEIQYILNIENFANSKTTRDEVILSEEEYENIKTMIENNSPELYEYIKDNFSSGYPRYIEIIKTINEEEVERHGRQLW